MSYTKLRAFSLGNVKARLALTVPRECKTSFGFISKANRARTMLGSKYCQ
jgi:hypothetical protein